jgi:ABC-type transport system involved in cytochrome bd biosynthesis fused ATPase/permease subunit
MRGALADLYELARPAPGEGRRLALSVALAAGAAAAAIALLATSGYLISRAAQRPPILMLMVVIVAVRAFGIARATLRYGERLSSHDLALRQLARLRVRFYRALRPLLPGALRGGHDSGELLARFVADVDALQDVHLRVLIPALLALLVALGATLGAWLLLPAAALVVLAVLALASLALPLLSGALAARCARRQAPARARLTAQLVESIDGAAELALAGRSQERLARLRAGDGALARLGRADALAAAAATVLGGVLAGAGLLALLLVAVPAVHSGALAGVLLAALVFLLLAAYENVMPLPLAARRALACATSARRLREVCDQTPTVRTAEGFGGGERAARAHGARGTLRAAGPDEGLRLGGEDAGEGTAGVAGLCMEGVRFRYQDPGCCPARVADDGTGSLGDDALPGGAPPDPWLLDGVTFALRPGERVALLGPSGAGKSTLAELLVRFHDPQSGRVVLDGRDVRALPQEELRAAVLLCGQEAHLFNTTIRANLLLANPAAGEHELQAALRAVALERWVAALPDGLDTLAGQQGRLLSGGQRQRLALARALLSPARFLILDEPTAHLDAPLARRVLAGVLAGAGPRGVLVITHDSSLLDGFERLLALREKTLANYGKPLTRSVAITRWARASRPA